MFACILRQTSLGKKSSENQFDDIYASIFLSNTPLVYLGLVLMRAQMLFVHVFYLSFRNVVAFHVGRKCAVPCDKAVDFSAIICGRRHSGESCNKHVTAAAVEI